MCARLKQKESFHLHWSSHAAQQSHMRRKEMSQHFYDFCFFLKERKGNVRKVQKEGTMCFKQKREKDSGKNDR